MRSPDPQFCAAKSAADNQFRSTDRFAAVREAYERREQNIPADKYSRLKPDSLLRIQEIERRILALLGSKGVSDLSQKKILEVGCGDGAWLRFLIQAGASPANVVGVDLLPHRIQDARRKCPEAVALICDDGSQLSYANESFDVILAMTLFSSILDHQLQQLLAREILRVLRKNGSILWYDFHVNNPRNSDVRSVTRHDINELFPRCRCELQLITLAPPLGRAVARAPIAYWLLSSVRILSTHYLGWITPRSSKTQS